MYVDVAWYGLLFGLMSYEFQHLQDLWWESDNFYELRIRSSDSHWSGFIEKNQYVSLPPRKGNPAAV